MKVFLRYLLLSNGRAQVKSLVFFKDIVVSVHCNFTKLPEALNPINGDKILLI